MPLTVKKIGNKWRLINKNTGKIDKTASGKARDGGGHASRAEALRQLRAIEMNR